MTLKNGIERMLMHWVPEVQGVVAVDDEGMFDVRVNWIVEFMFQFWIKSAMNS